MIARKRWSAGSLLWALPLLLVAVGTIAAWVFDLDREISRPFYQPEDPQGWPLRQIAPVRFLYDWGEVPAVLLGMAACLMIAWAARRRPERSLKRAGIAILLGLIVGPLLLTNGVFKSYYGRPRPSQTIEFGGERPFQPALAPTFNQRENSFPSGHAAAGFALLVPFFVLRKKSPGWAFAALGAGLSFGSVMGIVRIAQGGHFFSDVIWSAGVVYFSGFAVAAWLDSRAKLRPVRETRWSGRKVVLVRGAALAACALIALAYLARLPFNRTYEWVVPLKPGQKRANIELITRNGSARIVEAPDATELRVMATAQGRGLPLEPVKPQENVLRASKSGAPSVRYTFLPSWSTINFSSRIVVQVPPGVKLSIRQPGGKPPIPPAATPPMEETSPPAGGVEAAPNPAELTPVPAPKAGEAY